MDEYVWEQIQSVERNVRFFGKMARNISHPGSPERLKEAYESFTIAHWAEFVLSILLGKPLFWEIRNSFFEFSI